MQKQNLETIQFQAIDWKATTRYLKNSEDEPARCQTVIQVYGRINNPSLYGQSCCFEFHNFKTCFYLLKIPQISEIINMADQYLKNTCNLKYAMSILESLEFSEVEKKDYYGFNGDTFQKMIKVSSFNHKYLKTYGNLFINPSFLSSIYPGYSIEIRDQFPIRAYEINKDVIIQFLHETKTKPCGFCSIHKSYRIPEYETVEYTVKQTGAYDYLSLESVDNNSILPFVLAAYDIECISKDDSFPQAHRPEDKIVAIATTFSVINESKGCFKKIICVLNSGEACPPIEDTEVINCHTETELITKWAEIIVREDPDLMTTWNGFGFDDRYINKRVELLKIPKLILGRDNQKTILTYQKLSSSALGDNEFYYFDMTGRVCFDLMKSVQRNYTLSSYKLDNVASYFFRNKIINIDNNRLICDSVDNFQVEQYIKLIYNDGVADYSYENDEKFQILQIENKQILINKAIPSFNKKGTLYACHVKDDVKPKDLFNKYRSGRAKDLYDISRYNIQDCVLCNRLSDKLCIIINNFGMANVCYVPLCWIFNRGQSCKIFSIVSKKCMSLDYVVQTRKYAYSTDKKHSEDEEENLTYEGALVIDPKPGMYDAIFCLDYAALYPRSIICRNISHETFVMNPQLMENEDIKKRYNFNKVEYSPLNAPQTIITCWFAISKDGTKGLLPQVLTELLENRAMVRRQQKKEPDLFKKQVLEGLQLAYKVTCNSVYGQLGCNDQVGPIALMELAACTTATGREMLGIARNFAENIYPQILSAVKSGNSRNYCHVMNKIFSEAADIPFSNKEEKKMFYVDVYQTLTPLLENTDFNLKVVYGDTDSIMVCPNLIKCDTKEPIKGLELRTKSIKLGQYGSKIICKLLPKPENLEYEKILSPFLILSKKRYVGNLYENDPNKFYQKNMGVVLKRRDNAPIVKYIVGGIVDNLLNNDDGKNAAINFLKSALDDMLKHKFGMEYFTITKTLAANYKNRERIAHAVLADRVAQRDPGNAYHSNDRVSYVYIQTDKKTKLQGDKIETPEYVQQKKLSIDYVFYITNQIEKPSLQFLELFLDNPKDIFNTAIKKFDNKLKPQSLFT